MNDRLPSPILGISESQDPLSHHCQLQYLQSTGRNEETSLFRSWPVYDFEPEPYPTSGRLHWDAALGLVLSVGVSLGVWTAAGLAIAHLWR